MKLSIKLNILFSFFTLVYLTSCNKQDFNINSNPNSLTDSTVTFIDVMPSALSATGDIVAKQWPWLQNWMGYWAQGPGIAPDQTEQTYNVTSSFETGIWTSLYDNLYDYDVMEKKAHVANAYFSEGIARVMKTHDFQILVDIYNNIPYTEAFKGINNITPKYDNGIDIYKDLFRQLDTAILLFKKSNISSPTSTEKSLAKVYGNPDIMFSGDKKKWIQFANTLKLRFLIHLSNKFPTEFDNEYAIINAEGTGFLPKAVNAQINPGYRNDKPNPFWTTYGLKQDGVSPASGNTNYKANKWGMAYYLLYDDPRISKFYAAQNVGYGFSVQSSQTGQVYKYYNNLYFGLFNGEVYGSGGTDNPSSIGSGLAKSPTASQWIMTATESLFLQTEAQYLNKIAGDYTETYNEAVHESFAWLWNYNLSDTVSGGRTYSYLTNNIDDLGRSLNYEDHYNYYQGVGTVYSGAGTTSGTALDITSTSDVLNTIIQARWLALNGIAPYEVWTDYRRTGYSYGDDIASSAPQNLPLNYSLNSFGFGVGPFISTNPANLKTYLPYRLSYPQSEFDFNPKNAKNIDVFSSKIFWAK